MSENDQTIKEHSVVVPEGIQHRDPRFVTVERIGGWIALAIVLPMSIIGAVTLAIGLSPLNWLYWTIVGPGLLLIGLLAWFLHSYPAAAHRHATWRYSDQGLEIKRGVWFRQEITVPRARVQHTDVHQGPLLRKFGLAKLIVHTAGTRDATVELEGLSIETARSLRDVLCSD